MIKKIISTALLIFCIITFELKAQEADNKITLIFNELKTPLIIQNKDIKVQKFGAFLKLNAFGRINDNGKIIPVDLILSLPKFDYETPARHTYTNAADFTIDPNKDASLTIKLGDDTYSTFYRQKTGIGNNTQSRTTDYTITVYNVHSSKAPVVSILIKPGSFLSTSIHVDDKEDNETKRLTFSATQQVFEIQNPYPQGLKPVQ